MRITVRAWLACALLSLAGCSEREADHQAGMNAGPEQAPVADTGDDYGRKLGTVEFPVSCNDQAKPLMQRGLALLHHMTYIGAELEFSNAMKADPECALAYWGVAMSWVHPLWSDPPSARRLERGLELLRQARAIGNKTAREAAYIDAALAYFDGAAQRPEPQSLVLFRDGWEAVYREYPEDIEAAAFFALSHLATADAADKTFGKQAKAGSVAEEVLTKVADHPAAHHYIIHAYDNPSFADQALAVARNYSKVAPEVPHALHMPTHIFTRLGHWDDSIAMNARSSTAAEASTHAEYVSAHMLHADDYLVYAHLQKGHEEAAREVMDRAMQLQGPWGENAIGASAYALAAMPARFALERRNWSDGAQVSPRTPKSFPWSEAFAEFEAISWFGRGLGAARSGQPDVAAYALDELRHLKSVLAGRSKTYWASQVEIQIRSIEGWVAFKGGDVDAGLTVMQAAAELENATDKHPITPGELLPANELYGDMLLESGQFEAAVAAYRASLSRSPKRFNSLYGVGAAAEAMGDTETAMAYFGALVDMTAGSVADWPRLQAARAFVSDQESGAAGP